MPTPSLPPYDEYKSVAPPTYTSSHQTSPPALNSLSLPEFPHFTLSSPITSPSTSLAPIPHINTKLMTTIHGISMVPESLISMHLTSSEESGLVGKVRVKTPMTHIMTLYTRPGEGTERGRGCPTFVTLHWEKGKEKRWWFEHDWYGRGETEKFEWVDAMDEQARSLSHQNIASENYLQSNSPLKLISISTSPTASSSSSSPTQDPIAYFCPGQKDDKSNPRKIAGKLTFLPRAAPAPSEKPCSKNPYPKHPCLDDYGLKSVLKSLVPESQAVHTCRPLPISSPSLDEDN